VLPTSVSLMWCWRKMDASYQELPCPRSLSSRRIESFASLSLRKTVLFRVFLTWSQA
jgi:hypothetical protein